MGIQVWTSCRKLDRLDANRLQGAQKLCREQRVAIMNQLTLATEDAVDGSGHIPADLAHPEAVRDRGYASNRYLP